MAHSRGGFSLVELMIILTLLTILSGMYVGSVDLTGSALDRATRKVESDLRYAQQLAMTEEIPYGFITTGAQGYQIYRQNPGTLATDPYLRQGMAVDLSRDYKGVTFGRNHQFEFDKRGVTTIGGGMPLTLRQGARNRIISVTTQTGLIEVQPGLIEVQ